MSTEAAQVFFSLLTLLAGVGTIVLVGMAVAAAAGNVTAARVGAALREAGVWLAFLVALTATLGSLYFSEVADFIPCRLCWFQRIAMYPLSAILLVGAVRGDRGVRWYVAPIAAVGALISGYHYLIEWRPELDTGKCELFGPSCTAFWFREFGFITLAFMALVGFVTILALLFAPFPATLDADDAPSSDEPPTASPKQEVIR